MSIQTSSPVGSGGGPNTQSKSLLFGFKGADSISAPIQVVGAPVHIIAANLPEDCLIRVERLFNVVDGQCDPSVPPAPVYCRDGSGNICSLLYLFNVANPEPWNCPEERIIQNEIWLKETGYYQLVMEGQCNPETVKVWEIKDPLAGVLGCCPENICLPQPLGCVPDHVEIVSAPPTEPPDCEKCEAPTKYNPTTKCTYYWVAPPNSDCEEGVTDGYWEEVCECCPDTAIAGSTVAGGSCFDIPIGTSLWDSRVDILDPGSPFEFEFNYENTKNVVQYIDFDVSYWAARYEPTSDTPGQIFFCFGPQDITDIVIEPNLSLGPYYTQLGDGRFSIHDIPLFNSTYRWFIPATGFPPQNDVRGYIASGFALNISVQPDEIINYRGFFAVGYYSPTTTLETMHAAIVVRAHIHDGACYDVPCTTEV